jgi:hypothetical protein
VPRFLAVRDSKKVNKNSRMLLYGIKVQTGWDGLVPKRCKLPCISVYYRALACITVH